MDQLNFFISANICEYHTDFQGVFCDPDGMVSELVFFKNNMQGSLVAELGLLTNVKTLQISQNPRLIGTIPSSLVAMRDLQELYLPGNAFDGTIPLPFFKLWRNLLSLDLSDNLLVGTIPTSSQLQGKFQTVNLSGNDGLFADAFEILESLPTGLTEFLCSGCDLSTSSTAINWSRFSSLEVLDLSYAGIGGSVPSDLAELTSLRQVVACSNGLVGPIPSAFTTLPNLEVFEFCDNKLTGEMPLMQSPVLLTYNVENNLLVGNLRNVLLSLPPANLQDFGVGGNQVTGKIPDLISLYTELRLFGIPNTSVSGSIPNSVRFLRQLEGFLVENNSLTGTIPDALGRLPNMRVLHLHSNNFSDDLTEIFCPTDLDSLTADCVDSLSDGVGVVCSCCDCSVRR